MMWFNQVNSSANVSTNKNFCWCSICGCMRCWLIRSKKNQLIFLLRFCYYNNSIPSQFWLSEYISMLCLLNKVPWVPKCSGVWVPECLGAWVPEWPSAQVSFEYSSTSSAGVPKCPNALSARVPKCPLSALRVSLECPWSASWVLNFPLTALWVKEVSNSLNKIDSLIVL